MGSEMCIRDSGVRELIYVDDNLLSESDCQRRGETLLYQMKDPPIQIEIVTPGNPNILIGDRLTITIPAENINNENFDVIAVEHTFPPFITTVTMVNSVNTRKALPCTSMKTLLSDMMEKVSTLGKIDKTRYIP